VSQRTVDLRGLPEWLIRKYLVELGAGEEFKPREDGGSMAGAGWTVEWTRRKAKLPGSFHGGLTEFGMTFEGPEATLEPLFDTFMKKAQRGGG
jgi:hypothetical protein